MKSNPIIGLLQPKSEMLNREYALLAREFTRMDFVTTGKQAAPILDRQGLGPKALDGPGPHLKHLYSRLLVAFAVDLFKRSHADHQEKQG